MTPEHKLMNEIKIECGLKGYLVIRLNVFKGKMITPQGVQWVDSGIPEGFPDLMILRDDGIVCFIETKIHPRKATPQQLKVQSILKAMGYRVGTCYTLKEAMEVIENGNN